MAKIDLKKCILRLLDGAGNSINIKVGEGNLTYSEKRPIKYTLNKGLLDEVRLDDEAALEIKLDAVWEYITGGAESAGVPSIEDCFKRLGAAAGWVSTDSDTCRPFALDIEIDYEPTPDGCGDDETITFNDFRYEELAHDLRAGTIAISGKCNVTDAVAVRTEPPIPPTNLIVNADFADGMAHWTCSELSSFNPVDGICYVNVPNGAAYRSMIQTIPAIVEGHTYRLTLTFGNTVNFYKTMYSIANTFADIDPTAGGTYTMDYTPAGGDPAQIEIRFLAGLITQTYQIFSLSLYDVTP